MDHKWWYRAGIAVLVVIFILLIARTSIIGLRPDTAKIDRAVGGAPDKAAVDKAEGAR